MWRQQSVVHTKHRQLALLHTTIIILFLSELRVNTKIGGSRLALPLSHPARNQPCTPWILTIFAQPWHGLWNSVYSRLSWPKIKHPTPKGIKLWLANRYKSSPPQNGRPHDKAQSRAPHRALSHYRSPAIPLHPPLLRLMTAAKLERILVKHRADTPISEPPVLPSVALAPGLGRASWACRKDLRTSPGNRGSHQVSAEMRAVGRLECGVWMVFSTCLSPLLSRRIWTWCRSALIL